MENQEAETETRNKIKIQVGKGGEFFLNMNDNREKGYWNCDSKYHWKY